MENKIVAPLNTYLAFCMMITEEPLELGNNKNTTSV
jgi:hypothetical protein